MSKNWSRNVKNLHHGTWPFIIIDISLVIGELCSMFSHLSLSYFISLRYTDRLWFNWCSLPTIARTVVKKNCLCFLLKKKKRSDLFKLLLHALDRKYDPERAKALEAEAKRKRLAQIVKRMHPTEASKTEG